MVGLSICLKPPAKRARPPDASSAHKAGLSMDDSKGGLTPKHPLRPRPEERSRRVSKGAPERKGGDAFSIILRDAVLRTALEA